MRHAIPALRPVVLLCLVALHAACGDATGPGVSTADEQAPSVAMIRPSGSDTVSGVVVLAATATDDVEVTTVQFLLNGLTLGLEDREPPWELSWDTWKSYNGPVVVRARARDAAGNASVSEALRLVVGNAGTIEVTVDVNDAASTPGSDSDGIDVVVDGEVRGTVPGRGGSLAVEGLGGGSHAIRASALSFNCTSPEGPVIVTLAGDAPLGVTLPVACLETGTARVSIAVGGQAADPDGFTLLVDGIEQARIDGGGGEARLVLLAGVHAVALDGLFSSCSLLTETPALLEVVGGGESLVALEVNCERLLSQSLVFATYAAEGPFGNREIFRTDLDGSEIRKLTNSTADDFDPAWSPDGTRIAFVSTRDDARGEIYLMDADGSNVTRLTENTASEERPSWSPDGSRIAFAADDWPDEEWGWPDDLSVYVMNADGSGRQQLTGGESGIHQYPGAWTPDGTGILVERYNWGWGVSDLYRLASDGSFYLPLVGGSGGQGGSSPDFSPDGLRIAFAREVNYWDYGAWSDLVVAGADGTMRTDITATDADYETDPVWTSDGRILFSSYGEGGTGFWLVDPDGSNRELLLPVAGERPTLSP